ncbi:membrane protein [Heyndrickxia ginsengihumi]|uniref:Membrane protein n=1 Tax=Heyndrickxia ginsengihumi TaxID=363870 RepID=A0A0A6VF43_9BACI|nr:membrane protein [Heyndrickxia ginsengihumi]
MIVFSFILNIFGLMRLLPIYITSPLLFIVICLFIIYLNGRNRFKGFTLKK